MNTELKMRQPNFAAKRGVEALTSGKNLAPQNVAKKYSFGPQNVAYSPQNVAKKCSFGPQNVAYPSPKCSEQAL